jgi:hypothetical protein
MDEESVCPPFFLGDSGRVFMATQSNGLDDTGPVGAPGKSIGAIERRGAGHGARLGASKSPATEFDFADMKDGALVELVEDNPGERCLAIWKDGEVRPSESLEEGRTHADLCGNEQL